MINEGTGLSALMDAKIDLELRSAEINRIGEGLQALASLMCASDPVQTDGAVDVPILHGLGFLLDVVGEKVRYHGSLVESVAVDMYVLSSGAIRADQSAGSIR